MVSCNLEINLTSLFSEAGNIFTELTKYVQDQELISSTYPNLAYIYSEFSSYHFMKVIDSFEFRLFDVYSSHFSPDDRAITL